MLKQIIDLNFINRFTNQLAFQKNDFLNIALIIFSLIFVCLSYVLYKLYRANKQNKSISRIPDKSEIKENLNQDNQQKK